MARNNRWLLAEGARRTAERFRSDWARLPDAAWRRWIWVLTVGLAIGMAAMFGIALAGRRLERGGVLGWDEEALRWILAHSPLSFSAAIWAETPGNGVFMIPLVLGSAVLAVWLRRPLVALSILASYFMLDLIVGVGWLTWDRARPELVLGGAASPDLSAFPSGHVAQMMAAYGFWTFLWVRASCSAVERAIAMLLLLGATAAIALARLRLGAHWPSDIVAGALTGGYWLVILIVALRRAEAMLDARTDSLTPARPGA